MRACSTNRIRVLQSHELQKNVSRNSIVQDLISQGVKMEILIKSVEKLLVLKLPLSHRVK